MTPSCPCNHQTFWTCQSIPMSPRTACATRCHMERWLDAITQIVLLSGSTLLVLISPQNPKENGFVRGAPKTRRRNENPYFQKYSANNVCIFGVVYSVIYIYFSPITLHRWWVIQLFLRPNPDSVYSYACSTIISLYYSYFSYVMSVSLDLRWLSLSNSFTIINSHVYYLCTQAKVVWAVELNVAQITTNHRVLPVESYSVCVCIYCHY